MEERVELLVEDIKMLDKKGEEGTLTDEEVSLRKGKLVELWRLLKANDALIAQKRVMQTQSFSLNALS